MKGIPFGILMAPADPNEYMKKKERVQYLPFSHREQSMIRSSQTMYYSSINNPCYSSHSRQSSSTHKRKPSLILSITIVVVYATNASCDVKQTKCRRVVVDTQNDSGRAAVGNFLLPNQKFGVCPSISLASTQSTAHFLGLHDHPKP